MSCRLDNWSKECEEGLNKQINLEYWASYQYDYMWSYFDKSDVGLSNVSSYFKKAAEEERDHAHKLIEYQNLRGGNAVLSDIKNVDLNYLNIISNKNPLLLSFEKALDMEQVVYKSLLRLHDIASKDNDPQFSDFLEGTYLNEQVDAINQLTKYISQLNIIGENGHGIWHFDQNLK